MPRRWILVGDIEARMGERLQDRAWLGSGGASGEQCLARSDQGPGLDAAAELLYPLCPNLSACWQASALRAPEH